MRTRTIISALATALALAAGGAAAQDGGDGTSADNQRTSQQPGPMMRQGQMGSGMYGQGGYGPRQPGMMSGPGGQLYGQGMRGQPMHRRMMGAGSSGPTLRVELPSGLKFTCNAPVAVCLDALDRVSGGGQGGQ